MRYTSGRVISDYYLEHTIYGRVDCVWPWLLASLTHLECSYGNISEIALKKTSATF